VRKPLAGLTSLTLLSMALIVGASDSADTGKWRVVEGGDSPGFLRLMEESRRALLEVRCVEGAPELRIRWTYSLGETSAPVGLRFEEGATETAEWALSADHTETLYPGNTAAFVRRLQGAARLEATVTRLSTMGRWRVPIDLRGVLAEETYAADRPAVLAPEPPRPLGQVTAVFDLRGLAAASRTLGGCGL
jgi:hypothetical protein